MAECGKKGITHIVIESGGFSEYSHGDHTLEGDVLAVADKYGMKVIGPNCVGTVNFDLKMMMPFAFFKDIPIGGRLGLISQSGGVGGSYLRAVSGYGIKPGNLWPQAINSSSMKWTFWITSCRTAKPTSLLCIWKVLKGQGIFRPGPQIAKTDCHPKVKPLADQCENRAVPYDGAVQRRYRGRWRAQAGCGHSCV